MFDLRQEFVRYKLSKSNPFLDDLDTVYYQADSYKLDLSQYYVITFKVDKTFDYEGLEQAIYEAVSSYGIDIKCQ